MNVADSTDMHCDDNRMVLMPVLVSYDSCVAWQVIIK